MSGSECPAAFGPMQLLCDRPFGHEGRHRWMLWEWPNPAPLPSPPSDLSTWFADTLQWATT